jgi:hypothetical protein
MERITTPAYVYKYRPVLLVPRDRCWQLQTEKSLGMLDRQRVWAVTTLACVGMITAGVVTHSASPLASGCRHPFNSSSPINEFPINREFFPQITKKIAGTGKVYLECFQEPVECFNISPAGI